MEEFLTINLFCVISDRLGTTPRTRTPGVQESGSLDLNSTLGSAPRTQTPGPELRCRPDVEPLTFQNVIDALYCDYKPCTKTILQEKTAQENVACGTVALDFDEKQTKNVAQITMWCHVSKNFLHLYFVEKHISQI